MADKLEDEKEPLKVSNETSKAQKAPASSVASSLAGMFLEHNARKGREIEFPRLGIKIGKSNLRQANGTKNLDNSEVK